MSSESMLTRGPNSGGAAAPPNSAHSVSRRGGWRPVRTRQASAATLLAAQGEPMLWLAGGALAIAVTMIAGLLALILYQGLLTFWPQPVVQVETDDGTIYLGEIADHRQYVPQPEPLGPLADAAAEQAPREANA